jgi:exonuclease III
VLTINFQSIKNKKPEVELIIESCKPSIIFGTVTWLSNDISPYEYIPSSKYNIYTKNRKDGYGGVLLAISNQLTSTQITKAGTGCIPVYVAKVEIATYPDVRVCFLT